ncbi:MAG: hypothetical protein J7L61_04590, partial [Thermoplasmata archaeon]|nr:hypothetical protein [Thermoplasmata archaeon]
MSLDLPEVKIPDVWSLPPVKVEREHVPPFPFTAIVGQPHMKRAVMLALVNPLVESILLFGDAETGKGTVLRGGTALLDPSIPVGEIPLNVTRVQLFGVGEG